jgi:hypothetical protein
MAPCVYLKTATDDDTRIGICTSGCESKVQNDIAFDAEFSLPCGFFSDDFLDTYEVRDPPPGGSRQLKSELLQESA